MRTVEEHREVVAALLPVTPAVDLPLLDAIGLVLAHDLVATIDLPPFRNSAMDGYTAYLADVASLPVTLDVSQELPAGARDVRPLLPGTVARLMTGAPLPDGAQVIIPVEDTDGGVTRVTILAAPPAGIHVRNQGSDVAAGSTVLRAGTVLGPPQIGVAAALGNTTLAVHRPVDVLILSTGSELAEGGTVLEPGQVYESNAVMLSAALRRIGARSRTAHFVADDVPTFLTALEREAAGADLVVTSGGVSAGAYEVVKDALTGGGVEFAKVAMQPGMPQGAGRVHGVPIVTLPGNPVSSFVSFEVFLRPAILAAMGHADRNRAAVTLPLSVALDSPPGKRQFRRGVLDAIAGTVAPWGGPGSHLLGWLAGADAIVVVPEEITHLDAGEPVEVWLLD